MCVVCGATPGTGSLCGDCLNALKPLYGARCVRCSHPEPPPGLPCSGCETLHPTVCAQIVAAEYTVVRPAIIAYKYHRFAFLSEPFADLLATVTERHPAARTCDLVIPVPIHYARQTERGFNQSEPLANAIGARLGIPVDTKSLTRARATRPQARIRDISVRTKNVSQAFAVQRREQIEGKRILLVDDIITTGSTVAACADVLTRAGAASVVTAALAHPFQRFTEPIDINRFGV